MSELATVVRWRRYGHDRLYITAADQTRIGWWDLTCATPHPETPEHLPAVLAAVAGWQIDHPGAGTADEGAAAAAAAVPPPPVRPEHLDPAPTPVPATAGAQQLTHSDDPLSTSPSAPVTASALSEQPTARPGAGQQIGEESTLAEDPSTSPLEHQAVDQAAVEQPWVDLTANTPGALAREQARALQRAAPVRTVLARLTGAHTEERAWRIGAKGEVEVARRLTRLEHKDTRWRSLHAVPVGTRGSDIDHVVIGPGGVFTLNAKHHPGAHVWVGGNSVLVNGHRQPYVRNSRHEAARAARLLEAACGVAAPVRGVIVLVGVDELTIKGAPGDVDVLTSRALPRWLHRHDDVFTPDQIAALHAAARRSTTWTS